MEIQGIYNSKSKTIETDDVIYEIELKGVSITDSDKDHNIIIAEILDSYFDDTNYGKFDFVVFSFKEKSNNIRGTLVENYNEACDLYLEKISDNL